MSKTDKEKTYITRDEGDDFIWVWRKPLKGTWAPAKLKDCEMVVYMREDCSLDNVDFYFVKEFKKKFGIIINKKVKKCCHFSKDLLDSEDYKLISDDGDRKK